MQSKQTGFTIVELLVVIVVIGILAAISIVAYSGVQNRANDSAVRSNLAGITKKMELWKIDSSTDTYPATGELSAADIKISKSSYLADRNNFYYCRSTSGKDYSFGVISKSNQGFFLTSGVVSESTSANTYQSNTCAAVGEPSTSGVTGYVSATSLWSSWVK